ncbi:MAG: hypothetical protein IT306_17915 [Chloroflexi bacterium]|nr:hypothetical protein [Chloroflexota bacterium]
MSQSSAGQPTGGQSTGGLSPHALEGQFEAEVRAAALIVSAEDRAALFGLWSALVPIRQRLREADLRLEEEPSYTQKPAQWGGGVS